MKSTKKKTGKRPPEGRGRTAGSAAKIVADQAGLGIPQVIFTVKDAAVFLKVSLSLVYKLVETRQLPHLRIGKAVRFFRADLLDYLTRNKNPPGDQSGGAEGEEAKQGKRPSRRRGEKDSDWRKRFGL